MKDEFKKAKDLGTPIRDDLYSHVTEVFNRIMLHHPNDCYDRFETISMLVKHNNFKIKDAAPEKEINNRQNYKSSSQEEDEKLRKEVLDFI